MTFLCCENCIVEMICHNPCEKFKVDKLQLVNILSFNNCLRLMKKYQYKQFTLKNKMGVRVDGKSIYIYKNGKFHRDDGPAIIYANGDKSWWKNGINEDHT